MFSILLIFFTVGCGEDTRGWPSLNLPFESEQIVSATIDYNRQPYGKDKEYFKDFIEIDDDKTLKNVYTIIESFPYKIKHNTSIDTEKYWMKIEVTLFYNDDVGTKEYILLFYSYGVTKGYFILGNGDILYVPGDFATAIYERVEVE